MSEAAELLALIVAVAVVAAAARRLGLSAPLVLVITGVLASFVPGVPDYRLEPEIVLIGFLPPLLYAAALRTSLVDIKANRQAMGVLAVGAVIFTAVLVGLVVTAIVPGVPLIAGFALGAVVAPPDAVAATTIASGPICARSPTRAPAAMTDSTIDASRPTTTLSCSTDRSTLERSPAEQCSPSTLRGPMRAPLVMHESQISESVSSRGGSVDWTRPASRS